MAILSDLRVILKGGSGSGNFGHSGRVGMVGGSSNDFKNFPVINSYEQLNGAHENPRYWILPDNSLVDNFSKSTRWSESHKTSIQEHKNKLAKYDTKYPIDSAIESGAIRASQYGNKVYVHTDSYNSKTLKRLQKLVDEGKLDFKPGGELIWDISGFGGIEYTFEEFMTANGVIQRPGGIAELKQLQIKYKGGQGSGNYGHSGRQGKVGGSSPSSSANSVVIVNTADQVYESFGRKAYFIMPDNSLTDVYGSDLPGHLALIAKHPEMFGVSYDEVKGGVDANGFPKNSGIRDVIMRKSLANGAVRVSVDKNDTNLQVSKFDTKTLRKLQKLVDAGKLELKRNIVVEAFGITKFTTYEEFMSARYFDEGIREFKQLKIIMKGGSGSGNFNHSGRPGEVGGSSTSSSLSGGILPKEQRVWQGKQEQGKSSLSKLQTGAIGERIAMNVLSEKFGVKFGTLNQGKNNAPIDVAGDHHAIEVKTGISSNDRTAHRWRATIGQPGKAEAELLKKMNKDEKRQYNDYKREKIVERKVAALKKMSEIAGQEIKPAVVGVILSPDGKRADAFFIPGFHLTLNWKEYATEDYYLGTYEL